MKRAERFRMAWLNIRTWKRAYFRLTVCFVIISLMTISFTLYFSAIDNDINTIINEEIASAQIMAYQPLTEQQKEFLASRSDVADVMEKKYIYLHDLFSDTETDIEQQDLVEITVSNLAIELEGKRFNACASYNRFIEFTMSERLLSHNELKEAKIKGNSKVITGAYPSSSREIAIERAFLEAYGMGDECIGQTFSLIYLAEERALFEKYTVTGIVEEAAGEYEGSTFWFGKGAKFFEEYAEKENDMAVIDVTDFRQIRPLLSELEERYPEVFDTPIFNDDLNYFITLTSQKELMGKLVALLGSSLALALTLSVYYGIKHLLHEKAQGIGIYYSLGMRTKDVFNIFAKELCFILSISLLLGFALSVIIISILNAAVGELLAISFSLSAGNYFIALAIGGALLFGIGLLLSALSMYFAFRKGIVHFLKRKTN